MRYTLPANKHIHNASLYLRCFSLSSLCVANTWRKVDRQVKVLFKNLAIFFLFPSKEFLPMPFKIQLLETFPWKQKEQRQKQLVSDKLVTTQFWKLKYMMSLFSAVFSHHIWWILCKIYLKRIWRMCQRGNFPISNLKIVKYVSW